MQEILAEAIQELFIAMTSRRRQPDGTLAVGVSQKHLLQTIDINREALQTILEQLKEKIDALGMELIEYVYQGETWHAIRSNYNCPTELSEEEESTLAAIIEFVEIQEDPISAMVPIATLRKKLVAGKYFSVHQLDRNLKQLEYLGYVHRKRRGICYQPRTLLEFSQDARKHIAEESSKLIF